MSAMEAWIRTVLRWTAIAIALAVLAPSGFT